MTENTKTKTKLRFFFVLFVDIGRSENLIGEFTQPPIKVGKECKMPRRRETTKKKKKSLWSGDLHLP